MGTPARFDSLAAHDTRSLRQGGVAERADAMRAIVGDPTFRTWQLYLAGASGNFLNKDTQGYRPYCEAV